LNGKLGKKINAYQSEDEYPFEEEEDVYYDDYNKSQMRRRERSYANHTDVPDQYKL
jgi:hypothetical protein